MNRERHTSERTNEARTPPTSTTANADLRGRWHAMMILFWLAIVPIAFEENWFAKPLFASILLIALLFHLTRRFITRRSL